MRPLYSKSHCTRPHPVMKKKRKNLIEFSEGFEAGYLKIIIARGKIPKQYELAIP